MESKEKIVLQKATILREGNFIVNDICIEGGKISKIGENLFVEDARCIDVSDLWVTLGFVDVHVHFREPGFEYKEDIESGSRVAAKGGYTTVCTMPNLNPAPDCKSHLKIQLDAITEKSIIKIIPYGTITKGQRGSGELIDFSEIHEDVIGFSDDGRGVQSDKLMLEAMYRIEKVGGVISAHCEVDELIRGGYIHDGEYARANNHQGICSESEWRAVERDIRLAESTGCRYHICHISTKESVKLIRAAKSRGAKNISCETAPHYLVLCDEDLKDEGRFKMNPPLRSRADMEALREGVIDGTIDIIATDHAPHSEQEKSQGLKDSAMGIVGLETALPIIYTNLVESGEITVERFVELMGGGARRIFGIGGSFEVGQKADIIAVDLKSDYLIDSSTFVSQGRSTPFEEWKVKGENRLTIVDGEVVYIDKLIIL